MKIYGEISGVWTGNLSIPSAMPSPTEPLSPNLLTSSHFLEISYTDLLP